MNCFDLHIHSNHSFDSKAHIEDIIEKLVDKRYYGFSITDHNTITHIEYIQRLNLQNLLFIPGIEYTAEGIDLLLYNVYELPPENSTLAQTVEFVRNKNGIIVLAHPARYFMSISSTLLANIDGLELINKRYKKLPDVIEKAYKINFMEWCKRQKKALFANSDSHSIKDIGKVGTYISATNIDEFIWAVKNNLCFPSDEIV